MANRTKRIFLDYASTTPIDSRVYSFMRRFLSGNFANPSALYEEGVSAKKFLGNFRKKMALVLHAHPDEIIFTASGTEADNLALKGVFESAKKGIKSPHFITTVFEHPAILESMRYLEENGAQITYLPVTKEGFVSVEEVEKALKKDTVLVSVMYANNEIGTIQPIREIAKVIRNHNKEKKAGPRTLFHTDASQAALYCDINVLRLGIDLMTIDSSKIYGPKGIGMLFVKRGISLSPIIHGGGQERGLRSGTESIALVAGMSKALEISEAEKEKETARLGVLRDYLMKKVLFSFKQAVLNGAKENRLPNNANFCFPGIDSEFAVLKLDALGIMASSSSSCRSIADNSRSYVIDVLRRDKGCGESSLRFSMGRLTKKNDIDRLLKILKKVVEETRKTL